MIVLGEDGAGALRHGFVDGPEWMKGAPKGNRVFTKVAIGAAGFFVSDVYHFRALIDFACRGF
jgi:hypothetical protein